MRFFRADQTGPAVAVGPLEASVMEVLWEKGVITSLPEIHRTLTGRGKPLSYSAVKAVLNNLATKGLARKGREGKVTRFEAVQTREEFDAAVLSEVIGGLKRNFGAPAIAQLVGEFAVDEESLGALERAIAKRRSEMGSS